MKGFKMNRTMCTCPSRTQVDQYLDGLIDHRLDDMEFPSEEERVAFMKAYEMGFKDGYATPPVPKTKLEQCLDLFERSLFHWDISNIESNAPYLYLDYSNFMDMYAYNADEGVKSFIEECSDSLHEYQISENANTCKPEDALSLDIALKMAIQKARTASIS